MRLSEGTLITAFAGKEYPQKTVTHPRTRITLANMLCSECIDFIYFMGWVQDSEPELEQVLAPELAWALELAQEQAQVPGLEPVNL